ncbi:MAG TPA: ABC-2 family transporter protein [Streptosporangiaceae bacterium]|nr:ABC-2 family transporter protein [Streptosporangiaceae bacterium]
MADVRPSAAASWLHLIRGQARSQASYRASFVVDLISNVWATVFDVLTVLVLFGITRELGGFSLSESMLIVGLSACSFATADLLFGNIDRLQHYVRTGLLDTVLARPLAALPQMLAMELPLRRMSRAVFGAAVLAVALVTADLDWTPARVLLVVLAPLAGTVFFGSVFVASACLAFWWTETTEIGNAVTYGGRDFTTYPITIYNGWFRRAFAYGLGFASVAYYPALVLLGRTDPLGAPPWAGWASPAVAAIAATIAATCWRQGLRHYRSTGS